MNIFEQSGEQEIDLILMDIMMPVMDGLEATRRIRTCTHPRGATVPINCNFKQMHSDDIQKAKNAGMNEHLAKHLRWRRCFVRFQGITRCRVKKYN